MTSFEEDEEITCLENFIPIIFDAIGIEDVPHGFNAVTIHLDGSLKADLLWHEAKQTANHYLSLGLKLFWDINLGLFDQLQMPLSHSSQLLSFILSLEHFYKTLWIDYAMHSIGLCVYRGTCDFLTDRIENELSLSDQTKSIEERLLYCRDVVADYLQRLSKAIVNVIPCFLLLETSPIKSSLLLAELLSKEHFPYFHLGLKNSRGLAVALHWDDQPCASSLNMGVITRHLKMEEDQIPIRLGFCLPEDKALSNRVLVENVINQLERAKVPFRLIFESFLNIEWDGLDYLIVQLDALSFQGKRLLNGFKAAGGHVIDLNRFSNTLVSSAKPFCAAFLESVMEDSH